MPIKSTSEVDFGHSNHEIVGGYEEREWECMLSAICRKNIFQGGIQQCRSLASMGDGFLDEFGGAVDEEALLGANDCVLQELARGKGALFKFTQRTQRIWDFTQSGESWSNPQTALR